MLNKTIFNLLTLECLNIFISIEMNGKSHLAHTWIFQCTDPNINCFV
ncbi:hypothetical protein KM759_gp104 [Lymphocystis disease virus 4]|uniref:Uncharacterized protein n=1 Tax=Lymphocystis disease virus 4 TaxID=2704413 RepID=A0A6B9XMN6_9VIRU|nr:hypothetical protein KM759_gp104 [Lymphocystis disease virus 4]QHR78573.1 hypothetical protein [Lymphocystis disease virus 4]